MESIGTLAGGIAHDFNNVLGGILGNTELAQEDIEPTHPVYRNLESIKVATLKAAKIVSQLLSFSRIADKGFEIIDITPVINETLNFLRSTIPSTVQIHQHNKEMLIPVLADPIQINQVIMNLCINAYHSMGDSKGRIDVSVRITDSGMGLSVVLGII